MSLHNHVEQLEQIHEALENHGRRLESLGNVLLGNEYPESTDGFIGSKGPGYDVPSPRPSTLMGKIETGEFDLRRQVERIGGIINRLESVIQDPRNATASASKY